MDDTEHCYRGYAPAPTLITVMGLHEQTGQYLQGGDDDRTPLLSH